jgi:hypothetical protein
MSALEDSVIERAPVREVAAIFRSRAALDAAVQTLLLNGFDRSDIDVLAGIDSVRGRLGADYVDAKELPEVPHVPRQPYLGPEDFTTIVVLSVALLASASAVGSILAVLYWGGSVPWAVVAGIGGAACAGGLGILIAHSIKRTQEERFAVQMMLGGLVVWVRVRSLEQEQDAQRILSEHGGEFIRVHELELEKRVDDLPLSSLRPDPWLGDERLGQP